MEKLLQENIITILLAVILVVGGIGGDYFIGNQTFTHFNEVTEKQEQLDKKQADLDSIKRKKQKAEEKKIAKSGKVIYEVLGQQFSPEASFGIMFENILANITNSGIRIRSIAYNYKLDDDKLLAANAPGYNACELSFVTVGNYAQIQNFFKNIIKEKYLTSIQEIYIEPYDLDRTILIARFKIRLYTKTI